MTSFYVNNNLVYQDNVIHNYQRNGIEINGNGTIAVDYLTVLQKAEPINIAPNIPKDITKEKMNENINSDYLDMQPIISADGKLMFIDRRQHPGNTGDINFDDIWYSEKQDDGTWSPAKNIGWPLNNETDNSVMGITADNNTLLLSNLYLPGGKSANAKGFSISRRTASGWGEPVDMVIKNYYNDDPFGDACISGNGKSFLMSVGRKDSYGGRDIYVSFLQNDDTWSEPLNIGPSVNSFGDESGVFLAPDGVTLYFASSSWPGYGNRDLFVSKRLDDSWTKWSKPQNLGPNINTPNFEGLYMTTASGDFAFVTSYSQQTGDDIYMIDLKKEKKKEKPKELADTLKTPEKKEVPKAVPIPKPEPLKKEEMKEEVKKESYLPDPVVLVYGKVLDVKTKAPVGCQISYENLSNGKEAGIANSDPSDGDYKIVLPFGVNYGIHAKAPGYISVNENMELLKVNEYKEVEFNLFLAAIEVGQTIQLNNVFFVKSKAELLPQSYPELDRLIVIMKDNATMEITLSGHTDNVGDAKLNQILSEQRVLAVKQYMVSKGLGQKRITGIGYGGSKPIADNRQEATRKLNRRVEFTITKK